MKHENKDIEVMRRLANMLWLLNIISSKSFWFMVFAPNAKGFGLFRRGARL